MLSVATKPRLRSAARQGRRVRGSESPQAAASTARRWNPADAALVVWTAAALAVYFGVYFWNAGVHWLKLPALLSGLVRRLSG